MQRLDKDALLALLRSLYALNTHGKVSRPPASWLRCQAELAVPYLRNVKHVFNPARGTPSFRLSAERKALNEFKKACHDPLQIIDFMLFYVEQGVICTNTYGDIDAPFYDGLVSVYQDAAELANKTGDTAIIEHFRSRFARIVHDTAHTGWGFHDDLTAIYWELLPETDATT